MGGVVLCGGVVRVGEDRAFGVVLRELRLAAGLTQEELAAGSGLSVRSISDLERGGTRRPFFRSVELLADALGAGEQARGVLHQAALRARREHLRGRVAGVRAGGDGEVVGVWPVCQLPAVVADFTGRAEECARVEGLLAGGRDGFAVPVVVVSGAPGMGKTTLALRVAHAVRGLFPDGQLFVQFGGASGRPRDAGEVLGEVLRALGVAPAAIPEGVDQRAALYRSRLADRRVLVVADDAGSARQVGALLPGMPGCAVVVTSRSRLAGLGGAGMVVLDSFSRGEAVELLGRIVGGGRVVAERGAADRVVEACGRLPLAVRIAGAKLAARPGWPLARMAGLVADERGRLDALVVADLAVRSSVAASYEVLDERVRRGFARLALLGAVDVAEWVVAALLDEVDAGDVVNVLVDRSLLVPAGVDGAGEPRYRLHDLLRDYAAERVAGQPQADQDAAMSRVLTAYLQLATQAARRLPRLGFFSAPGTDAVEEIVPGRPAARLTADPVAWLSAERLNLLAVTRWACAHGRYRMAARLASCQPAFHFLQHRIDDAEQVWRMIKDAAERAGDIATSSEARFHLAWAMADRGRFADAYAALDRCIPILMARGVSSTLALALYWKAFCAEGLGYYEVERDDAERCLGLARQLRERGMEVHALRILGLAVTRLGSPDRGIQLCEQAVAIARDKRELVWEFSALTSVAFCMNLAGRYGLAADVCQRGIKASRRLSLYVTGEAFMLGMLGDAHAGQGRYEESTEALTRALAIFEQYGDRRGQALCLLKLGQAHIALGELHEAADVLQQCFPMFGELGLPAYEDAAIKALDECRPSTDVTLVAARA